MDLRDVLRDYKEYGIGFWAAAIFSMGTLINLWIDAIAGTSIISEKFMKPFPELINLLGLDIPLSTVTLIVMVYVFDNELQRHRGLAVQKPGEFIFFFYAVSYVLMMFLTRFGILILSENLHRILLELLTATYLPYKFSKNRYEKANNKNNNNNQNNGVPKI